MDIEPSIREIEAWAGGRLPQVYVDALRSHGGTTFDSSVLFYAAEMVIERNETFESKSYCPGIIAIGDDGGGLAVVIPLQSESCPVSLVDHGSMDPEDFHPIAESLSQWIGLECPIK